MSILKAPSGTFNSPYYPEKYVDYWNCSYFITVDKSALVNIIFNSFQLNSDEYVQIFDGPTTYSTLVMNINGAYDPAFLPSLVSSTNELLVVFTARQNLNYYDSYDYFAGPGFLASYYSVIDRLNHEYMTASQRYSFDFYPTTYAFVYLLQIIPGSNSTNSSGK